MSRRIVPVVKGDKDVSIIKEAEGGVGRMRCPKCQNLAVVSTTAKGKKVKACPVCGAMLIETKM